MIITALLFYICMAFIYNRAVILYSTNLVMLRPASLHVLLARKLAIQPSINQYVCSAYIFTHVFTSLDTLFSAKIWPRGSPNFQETHYLNVRAFCLYTKLNFVLSLPVKIKVLAPHSDCAFTHTEHQLSYRLLYANL